MTNSSSRKSPDSEKDLDLKDLDPDFALPVEVASAQWLKELCRSFYAKGFARGWARGIHDACASSIVNDSRIVRPADVSLIKKVGGN